ncbi:MAG TPA: DUF1254 domain-containing protein [Myxococcota bacterium]|nr:DUF1254 domain-containing protein [Myxococcota bacterium]
MLRRIPTLLRAAGLALGVIALAAPALAELTPDAAHSIAKEAYVYGYPLIDEYRMLYAYAVDTKSPAYKAPFNTIKSEARVFTPEDKAVSAPNSDTAYSYAVLDLRAEPLVFTLPPIEKDRYYSVQLVDLYSYNFGYLGTRATGNSGGSFLVAGPGWKGETPKGVVQVIRADTELGLAIYRTQLKGPADLDTVKKIQSGYKLQTLSAFLGKPAPPAAPKIDFVPPLSEKKQRMSPRFFSILAFVLRFCPTLPDETALRERFAKIGVVPGKPFVMTGLSREVRLAFVSGIKEGQQEIDALRAKTKTSSGLFGSRTELGTNYVKRALAAQMGNFGNSKDEAFNLVYGSDGAGQPLDASKQRYVLHFAKGALPPAKAFWSLTMYRLPQQLLVANPLNRYLINSTMLSGLKRDPDGGLTLYVQSDSPGKDHESNWLPAPKGPFAAALRLYLPEAPVLDGSWKAPVMEAHKD